ncbi:MAG: dTDP-4-dehydrorhamnose 3,5-epimerase family protein, partial [Treponema sp.]
MPFTFTKCVSSSGIEILGLYEIRPKVFGDARGYFFECYSERDFFAAGLTMKFVQ